MTKKQTILFILILVIGIIPRIWNFGAYPSDLHQDEVGNGIDSYYLSRYGYDRTAITYPIHFVSWGDGSSALYSYLAIPFVKLFGLNPITIRLPNLMAGIFLIPLGYLLGKKLKGISFGLLVMFLTAISPWSIMGSRYALEPYFIPFQFAIGFLLFLNSDKHWGYLLASMVVFSLCLYTYSTSFSVLPIFLLVAGIRETVLRTLPKRVIWAGCLVFLIVSLPIIMFVIINTFKLPQIQFFNITIPRLPIEARYQTLVVLFQDNMINGLLNNLWTMLKLLLSQSDGWYRNVIPPFGYLYPLAPIFAIVGIVLRTLKNKANTRDWFYASLWMISCLSIGVLQTTNFNRMSLIYIPLTLFVAYFWEWLISKNKTILKAMVGAYLIAFTWFCSVYFNPWYQSRVDNDFNRGLLAAIQSTSTLDHQICFSDSINTAYMYVLYLNQPDPKEFVRTIGKINSGNPFRDNHPLSRYKFGYTRCENPGSSVLIHRNTEKWLGNIQHDIVKTFNAFIVEYPE